MKNVINVAEKTGLQKLTQEQLINIIFRKDEVEQKLRLEVKMLMNVNRRLSELIEEINGVVNI